MATILTPTPPVRFCISRLRQAVAEPSRFSDGDLLDLINAGYQSACRRSMCLERLVTMTFPAGSNETALPLDWVATKRVYAAGAPLDPVDFRRIEDMAPGTYYQYGSTIGLPVVNPDADTDVLLLYARVPILLGYEDVPEWGQEWNYLLRAYSAWRCILAAGGAQTTRKAVLQRQQFENGVRALRHSTRKGAAGGSTRARTAQEGAPAVAS